MHAISTAAGLRQLRNRSRDGGRACGAGLPLRARFLYFYPNAEHSERTGAAFTYPFQFFAGQPPVTPD
jgi:hypothetical protein